MAALPNAIAVFAAQSKNFNVAAHKDSSEKPVGGAGNGGAAPTSFFTSSNLLDSLPNVRGDVRKFGLFDAVLGGYT
jgi:hypothetical protein